MLPLDGVRVLDLTWYTAGPFCTRLLADYGADVLKVERPGSGDPARGMPPFYHDEPGLERSGLFLALNTGKRGVTLDLKTPQGSDVLRRLAERADVLVENFRPGVMESLGLDYGTLSAINPRLVMTSISNFGQTGPYRDWQSSDLVMYAMGGAMINTGHPEREPLKLSGHVPSFHVGAAAAAATSVALVGAEASGEGDHLDVSAFEVWMGAIDRRMTYLMGYQYTGEISTRQWPASALGSGTWVCQDGYFSTTSGVARFANTARMVGAAHLLSDPSWSTPAALARPERVDEFAAIIVPWMLDRKKKEIREACQKFGVLGAPINTIADLLEDEHFLYRRFFQEIEHPTTGSLTYPGYSFRIHSDEGMPPRRRAPLLGEHTEQILREELGLSAGEVQDLRSKGVV